VDTGGHARSGEADRALRLVVLADSFAFTDAAGPQLPDAPHLWPNVVRDRLAAGLDRAVERSVVARPGWGVRELWRALTKDRHLAFEVVGAGGPAGPAPGPGGPPPPRAPARPPRRGR
jgi:hypothetical protein